MCLEPQYIKKGTKDAFKKDYVQQKKFKPLAVSK